MAASTLEKRRGTEKAALTDSLMKINLHELALEMLTQDWLKKDADPSMLLYLTEKVLPVLVMSLEQLLVVVSRKGLEDQEGFRDDFNPVNFLAEYLMRHNPRYPRVLHGSSSRYYNGLKEVTAELRRRVIQQEEGLVERVKKDLKEKRENEEEERRKRLLEEERRREILKGVYQTWQNEDILYAQQILQVTDAWIESGNATKYKDTFCSFTDIDNISNETTWTQDKLISMLQPISLILPSKDFDDYTEHLVLCGKERRRNEARNKRKLILKDTFIQCDGESLGVIDRRHLMSLFNIYYDHVNETHRRTLTDPRTWPATEDDNDDIPPEEWEREGSTVSDEDYQDFMSSTSHETTTESTQDAQTDEDKETHSDTSRPHTHTSRPHTQGMSPGRETVILPSGPGEQWRPQHVDLPQFLQLCDLLLGDDDTDIDKAESLSSFLKKNFHGDDYDISKGSEPVQQAMLLLRRAQKLSSLFNLWDTNCSGYLHVEELMAVLSYWGEFGSDECRKEMESSLEGLGMIGNQVNKTQFINLLEMFTDDMTPNNLKDFLELMQSSIKLTQEQEARNAYRQTLLNNIRKVGHNNINAALTEAVKSIQQDSRNYGGGKKVSVCIGLLERLADNLLLSYKTCSDDGAYHVLGKKLSQTQAPVSFSVVANKRPVYVPNIHKHGHVYFFIPEHSHEQEYHGSLVVVPILSVTGGVVGTISIDCVSLVSKPRQSFEDHEIAFYQGVGACIGEVHHETQARKRLTGAAEAGMTWLLRRCPIIDKIDFYLTCPEEEEEDQYYLQLALHSEQNDGGKIDQTDQILRRKENFFKEYLFQCVDTSETVSTDVYCHPHLCCPLRNDTGCAIAVLDLTLTKRTSTIDPQYTRDINKMIKLLTAAFQQASTSDSEGPESVDVLFHKLLLSDLQYCMEKLDKRAFAELRSYVEPPPIIHNIIKALIMILYPNTDCNKWSQCKPYINVEMLKVMINYQPSLKSPHLQLPAILQILQEISPKEVFHHGSLPTRYLYTWVSACTAILEHINSSSIISID